MPVDLERRALRLPTEGPSRPSFRVDSVTSLGLAAAHRLRTVAHGFHRVATWLHLRSARRLLDEGPGVRICNICDWHGSAFEGEAHSESAVCPSCKSIARDRFLYYCFQRRTHAHSGMRVLETSPRLGEAYRSGMRRRVDYLCSGFNDRPRRGELRIDLRSIQLPDASLDVVLTAHVLEHVPDTEKALAEIWRVLRPGGRIFIQVPLLQGTTSVPAEPEHHGDNTLVYWRFGWDLTDKIRGLGFACTILVPEDFHRGCLEGRAHWATRSPEFDVDSLVSAARPEELTSVADDLTAQLHGFEPSYMFATWECVKQPGRGQ